MPLASSVLTHNTLLALTYYASGRDREVFDWAAAYFEELYPKDPLRVRFRGIREAFDAAEQREQRRPK
jgi:hypothetical protein